MQNVPSITDPLTNKFRRTRKSRITILVVAAFGLFLLSLYSVAGRDEKTFAHAGPSIAHSARFNGTNEYLARIPGAAATSNKIFTLSVWAKKAKNGGASQALAGYQDSGTFFDEFIGFDSADKFLIQVFANPTAYIVSTTAVFRDPSRWYHIVVVVDTTQATAANREQIYVDGTQVTALSGSYLPQNFTFGMWQQSNETNLGAQRRNDGSGPHYAYFSGYLSDIYLIDGQALAPTAFGAFDANGYWEPISFTGTYGTNGFHIDFN